MENLDYFNELNKMFIQGIPDKMPDHSFKLDQLESMLLSLGSGSDAAPNRSWKSIVLYLDVKICN